MRRIISLNSGRRAPAGFVEMNAHENRFGLAVRDRGPVCKRNVGIVRARHYRYETPLLQMALDAMGHIKGELFFHQARLRRSGILTTVTGIDDDSREGRGWRRGRL